MNLTTQEILTVTAGVMLLGLVCFAIRYRIKNEDVHQARLNYFKPIASAVRSLAIGCFFLNDLPAALVIDKMRTRPLLALIALRLKARALGMSVMILGYPGVLVGLLMDGDDVRDVEIVGWGMMNAPLIKRMSNLMGFKISLRGWFLECGLKVLCVNGVYWVGSKRFVSHHCKDLVNLGGNWMGSSGEITSREIARMLNNSHFEE